MKRILTLITFMWTLHSHGQVKTILDSLNYPIAFTFVKDDVYMVLHGQIAPTGSIISFNVNDPYNTFQTHFDSLIYPRAIVEKDSIIYIALRDQIVAYNLKIKSKKLDTLHSAQFLFTRAFAFENNILYFAHEDRLSKLDINQQPPRKVTLKYFNKNPLSLAIDDKKIYIASGKSIFEYDLSENRLKELIKDLPFVPYSIAIHDHFLYLDQGNHNYESEEILAFNLKKLEAGPTSFCTDVKNLIGLYIRNNHFYFASTEIKIGISNGEFQMLTKALLKQPKEYDISIFPNPVREVLYIETLYNEGFEYQLYDLSGKLLYNDINISQLDMRHYPQGIYLLKFNNSEKGIQGAKKIVKVMH